MASKSTSLDQYVHAYSSWRSKIADSVGELRSWLHAQDLGDPQAEQRLDHVVTTLRDDKLYIAFVAEFSRGKSELINAIFFANFGQRILPSSAGRTTMCPTELLHDRDTEPSLQLLPIETRKNGTTIAEYKTLPEEWKVKPLNVKSSSSMIETLKHIVETRAVTREAAQAMGFHIAEDETQIGLRPSDDGLVD
ncbi:MAG: dynamin family protein, partial [Pseudomonadota bacterium]